MAMIKCMECGKDISDKAKKCPYCNKTFIEEVPAFRVINCSECGIVLSETDEVCHNCGCPIEKGFISSKEKLQEVQISSVKVGSKTKKIIVALVIILALCAAGGIGYKVYSNQKANENYNSYIDNLEKAQELMLSGGSDAESLCNLTLKVWGNAIYEESDIETDKYTRPDGYFVDDFNTALGNLFVDSDTKSTVSNIESNQESVKHIMKKLQDVPEGLDKCYETVSDLNASYNKLADLAINPTGNYSGFSSNKTTAISEFMLAYNKLDTQIPDRK